MQKPNWEIVDSTAGCERLSVLDAYSGHHHIRLYGTDEIKTTFVTPFGCFCYVTIPFGLKNVGALFMRMIQKCLLTQTSRNVEAYMDDIVAKSRKGPDLLTTLAETFANLRRYDIKLNPSKCTFGVPGGKLLVFSFPNEESAQTQKRLEQSSEWNTLCVCMMFRSLRVVWVH